MTAAAHKVPLRLQADCLQRELAMRHRVYPNRVKNGKMTAAEQAREIDTMRAARDTLRLFAEFEDSIRETVRRCLEDRKRRAEWDEIKGRHNDLTAVEDTFPGVTVTDIRPIGETHDDRHNDRATDDAHSILKNHSA